jgi:hypothetical protein
MEIDLLVPVISLVVLGRQLAHRRPRAAGAAQGSLCHRLDERELFFVDAHA